MRAVKLLALVADGVGEDLPEVAMSCNNCGIVTNVKPRCFRAVMMMGPIPFIPHRYWLSYKPIISRPRSLMSATLSKNIRILYARNFYKGIVSAIIAGRIPN